MPTQEAPAWSFEKTGTPTEIENAIRGESFGGNKNAQELANAAVALIDTVETNGVRVSMREAFTQDGYRYRELILVDVPLLLQEGEAGRREHRREMR
jgi:hypothetical protein